MDMKPDKREYVEPQLEIIEFEQEDIITTSGFGMSFGDDDGNITFPW